MKFVIRNSDNALMEVVSEYNEFTYEVRNVRTKVLSFLKKEDCHTGPRLNPYGARYVSRSTENCTECGRRGYWVAWMDDGGEIGTWCDDCEEAEDAAFLASAA